MSCLTSTPTKGTGRLPTVMRNVADHPLQGSEILTVEHGLIDDQQTTSATPAAASPFISKPSIWLGRFVEILAPKFGNRKVKSSRANGPMRCPDLQRAT